MLQETNQEMQVMQVVLAVKEEEEKEEDKEENAIEVMTDLAYLTLGLREVIVLKLIHFKHKTSITLYTSLSLYIDLKFDESRTYVNSSTQAN